MSKQMYVEAHEELIAEFLESNPGASWFTAYDLTQEHVEERLVANLSALQDQWQMQEEA